MEDLKEFLKNSLSEDGYEKVMVGINYLLKKTFDDAQTLVVKEGTFPNEKFGFKYNSYEDYLNENN